MRHKTLVSIFETLFSDFDRTLIHTSLFALLQVYKVEITHDISTWIIYRRYSQFYALLEEVRLWCVCVFLFTISIAA